jgi:copper resistance protein B
VTHHLRLGLTLVLGLASPVAAQQTPPDPHAGHAQPAAAPAQPAKPARPAADAPLPPSIRPITDADRAAAFPDVAHGHSVHDDVVHTYVLFDELEWRAGRTSGLHWDVDAWIGKDRDRLWLRAEGVSDAGAIAETHVHALYGRAIARWWDVVAGIRQDGRPGDPQTWAAVGLQGLAPYRIDLEITGYVGAGGRTQVRADASHDLRLTRRLIAQTRIEATLNGKADPARHAEPGLASVEAGVRVRYEIRRELAPYVGLTWQHEAAHGGYDSRGAQLTVGVRVWR